jgi:hypothetical protein
VSGGPAGDSRPRVESVSSSEGTAAPASSDMGQRNAGRATAQARSRALSQAGSICPRGVEPGAGQRLGRCLPVAAGRVESPRVCWVGRGRLTTARPWAGSRGRGAKWKSAPQSGLSPRHRPWRGPSSLQACLNPLTLCSAARIVRGTQGIGWYLLTNLPAQALLEHEGTENRDAEFRTGHHPKVGVSRS